MRLPKPIRCWRAPRWSPVWLRRAFPGCWTQEEIDQINAEAHRNWLAIQPYIEQDDHIQEMLRRPKDI